MHMKEGDEGGIEGVGGREEGSGRKGGGSGARCSALSTRRSRSLVMPTGPPSCS